MAVFGAPFPQADHADRAVAAAVDMHALQAEINRRWERQGMPAFGLGLGLSTGEAAAALLGSAERLEYTLVGDTVNLSQRLQQFAAAGETVLSEATVKALSAPVDLIPLPPQMVKGRDTPVVAFKLTQSVPGHRPAVNQARYRRGSDMTTTDMAPPRWHAPSWPCSCGAYARPSRPRTRRCARCAVSTSTSADGEFVALTGPSGCGKSTLLNLAAGLDLADEGTIDVAGEEITGQSEDELARMRRRHIGIVFQFFNLLEGVTVLENVALAAIIAGRKRRRPRPGPGTCSTCSASATRPAPCPACSPAGSASAWPSPGRWRTSRRCCWPTSPPARWTPTAARRLSSCSAACTRTARRSCSSPMTGGRRRRRASRAHAGRPDHA